MHRAADNGRIAAVIVAYGPEPGKINKLIANLARDCGAVLVMDNGGGRQAVDAGPLAPSALRIIDMGGNAGLGGALNAAFERLAAGGFEYVATFDQDSDPGEGQILSLVGWLARARAARIKVAAVGPLIVDRRLPKPVEHPFMGRAAGWPVGLRRATGADSVDADFLITSGAVISMDAYRDVGPFDERLFVDYTDADWCMRARRRGYRLVGLWTVVMTHELSAGDSPSVLGMTILRYGPIRRYYYARNVVLLSRRSHVPVGWKARLLLGLMFRIALFPIAARFSGNWTRDWRMMLEGALDGLLNRGGIHPDARVRVDAGAAPRE